MPVVLPNGDSMEAHWPRDGDWSGYAGAPQTISEFKQKPLQAGGEEKPEKPVDLPGTQKTMFQRMTEVLKYAGHYREPMRYNADFEGKHSRDADGKFQMKDSNSELKAEQGMPAVKTIVNESGVEIFPVNVSKEKTHGATEVQIGDHGHIQVRQSVWDSWGDVGTKIRRALDDSFWPYGDDVYIRVSYSEDDYAHIKKGTHRGSINHATGEEEGGLSVSKKAEIPADHAYLVRGKKIGQGTDGEPLLDLATVEVVGEMMTESEFTKDLEEKRKNVMKERGWSEHQFSKAWVRPSPYSEHHRETPEHGQQGQ